MLAARVLRRCKPCERRVQTKHHLLFTLALDFPGNSSGRAAFHTPQSCRVITTQRTTHHGSRLQLVTRSKHHPDALHLRRTRKPHRANIYRTTPTRLSGLDTGHLGKSARLNASVIEVDCNYVWAWWARRTGLPILFAGKV